MIQEYLFLILYPIKLWKTLLWYILNTKWLGLTNIHIHLYLKLLICSDNNNQRYKKMIVYIKLGHHL